MLHRWKIVFRTNSKSCVEKVESFDRIVRKCDAVFVGGIDVIALQWQAAVLKQTKEKQKTNVKVMKKKLKLLLKYLDHYKQSQTRVEGMRNMKYEIIGGSDG